MTERTVAFISGASRGIGRAVLTKLAEKYFVIGTATTQAGVEGIDDYLKQNQLTGRGELFNATDFPAVKSLIGRLIAEFGVIKILVNNAGITRDNLMLRMNFNEEWQPVIDTNLNAVFYLTQQCLPAMMKARFGRVINMSSVVGLMGNPGQVNYCAAKAGLLGLTKAMAREVASRNITVNAIAPGYIETDMTKKLNEVQQKAILDTIPMRRIGSPEDIASAVSFLASEDASYMTGQVLNVNGGMYM